MPRTERQYQRIKTSTSNQAILRDSGYTPVFSSNVSAIQRDGSKLYIRFHNGSVYMYPNEGQNFNKLLTSPSKGEWVWRNLRAKKAPFNKVGSFPLQGDADLTDKDVIALAARTLPKDKLLLAKEMTTLLTKLPDDIFMHTVPQNSLLTLGVISTLVG